MVINPIVGVYIPIVRIPVKGGMTIPNIATFDHGTYHSSTFRGTFANLHVVFLHNGDGRYLWQGLLSTALGG